MSSPVRIGLTTYVEQACWGAWDERAALLPVSYSDGVAKAGALPVLLPPILPGDADVAAASAVAGIHGLVLTGGSDVDPELYGAPPHAETDVPQPGRDAWELALLRAALGADLPVLAICRGAQLLNVACGGTLHQHLPEVLGDHTHRPVRGAFSSIAIEVVPGSRLATILGDEPGACCSHHQAIDRVGDGLRVTARAADGTVEAIELSGAGFALGVQWHPEEAPDGRLLEALVAASTDRRR